MKQELVDRIVNAVLYEGYILYPYRPSVKNRQRWFFGGLFPESYCRIQPGEPWKMQTECLVIGSGRTRLDITVRFLHLQERLVGEMDPKADAFRPVESLQVGDRYFHAWQEAVERRATPRDSCVEELMSRSQRTSFDFPAHSESQLIMDPDGLTAGVMTRRQTAVHGLIELSAMQVGKKLFKVRVRISNQTPVNDPETLARDQAVLCSLASTHTILNVTDGEFVSLIDPPEEWREIAADCQNEGAWPVLVGEPPAKDVILSSPITLYDYPQIAPESPGDLFDGTEIDEILTLRIQALTSKEKATMAQIDERARGLLQRTETLTREQMMGLHGTFRNLHSLHGGRP
jgi:hydrogenase maturation protease